MQICLDTTQERLSKVLSFVPLHYLGQAKEDEGMIKKNPFKPGDKVRYKRNDDGIYIIYAVYSPTRVSLGLKDYPDTEQDMQTNITEIVKADEKSKRLKI